METLKEKFDNLILENIPKQGATWRFEIETIREETSDFKDKDAIEIFEKTFNFLYFMIEKTYPNAMRHYVEAERIRLEEERVENESRILAEEEAKKIEAEQLKKEKIAKTLEIANRYKKKSGTEAAPAGQ